MPKRFKFSKAHLSFVSAVGLRSSVIVAGFIIFLISSFLYGPAGRGVISFLTAFYLSLSLFASLGLGRVAYQRISRETNSAGTYINTLVRYIYGLSFLMFLLVFAGEFFAGKAVSAWLGFDSYYFFLFFGSFPYYIWLNFSNYLFSATQSTESHDRAIFVHRVMQVALMGVAAYFHVSLGIFLLIYGLSCFGIFILESDMLRRAFAVATRPGYRESYHVFKGLLKEFKWPYIDSIAQTSPPLTAFLLGLFVSQTDLGNYNFAIQILTTLSFPFGVLQIKLQEKFAQNMHRESSHGLIRSSFAAVLPLSLLIAFVGLIIPEVIQQTKLAAFHEAIPLLKSLLLTLPLTASILVFQSVWVGSHRPRLSSMLNLITTIINISAVLIFLPSQGIYAGVTALYISCFCGLAVHIYALSGHWNQFTLSASTEANFTPVEIVGSIVVFNPNLEVLFETISSFLKTSLRAKVIIWDNSSEDKISPLLKSKFGNDLEYYKSPDNFGYGRGHNEVFARIKNRTKYFCVVNPDIIVPENSLRELADYLGEHPNYGLITGNICDMDGVSVSTHKKLPSFFNYGRFFIFKKFFKSSASVNESDSLQDLKGRPCRLPVISGCFMLFTREHYEELRGFDQRFFLYFEDWDLSVRSFMMDKSLILPHVKILHGWARQSHKRLRILWIHLKSAFKFYTKWGFTSSIVRAINAKAGLAVVSAIDNEHSCVAAVVVLYHPKKEILQKLILSVHGQVGQIIIIDNSEFASHQESDFRSCPKLTYKALNQNLGIAKAQNIGIQIARSVGCDHILLLDQDSCLEPTMVKTLLDAESLLIAQGYKVAVIGPRYKELNTDQFSRAIRHQFFELNSVSLTREHPHPVKADYIISSGSLLRTSVLNKVGVMKEDLFIDGVDIEWCYRAHSFGFETFIVSATSMVHTMGDDYIKFFGKPILLHHSQLRNFYHLRNYCYFFKLPHISLWWKIHSAFKLPFYITIYSIFTKHRTKHFFSMIEACRQGFAGRLGPASIKNARRT